MAVDAGESDKAVEVNTGGNQPATPFEEVKETVVHYIHEVTETWTNGEVAVVAIIMFFIGALIF